MNICTYITLFGVVCLLMLSSVLIPTGQNEGANSITCILDLLRFYHEHAPDQCHFIWNVITEIRLPRAVSAAACGASLGLAGVISQGVFRNALASPSLIGVQSGGVLCAVLGYSLFSYTHFIWIIPLFAFCGCFMTFVAIYSIFSYGKSLHISSLVVMGFALHISLAGITSFILSITLDDVQRSSMIVRWMFGSFALASWMDVWLIIALLVLGAIIARKIYYALDVYSLGDEVAISLNVSPLQMRKYGVLAVTILVSGVISIGAGIPFVGLMAPHFARMWVGGRHAPVMIMSAMFGAIITVVCDSLAQRIFYPLDLEVGIILSILGGIFFIYLMMRSSKIT